MNKENENIGAAAPRKGFWDRVRGNGVVQGIARGVIAVGENKVVATVTATLGLTGLAAAQTDATVIATNAQTAFGVIAPITITIAGFYVILKIAKKVVH